MKIYINLITNKMKQKSLLKVFFLLCALIVGSTSVWGQVATATATNGKSYVVAYYANSKYYALPHGSSAAVWSGTEVSLNALGKVNTSTASSLAWTLTEGSTSGQFYLTYASGNSTYYLLKSGGTGNNNKLNVATSSNTDYLWEFTLNTGNNDYTVKSLKSIQSGTTGASLIYLGYTTVGQFGMYTSSNTAKIILLEIGDVPAYTITALSNNTNYGTVSLDGSVITANPKDGYRISKTTPYTISPSGSATVSQNGNQFTISPSANTTITINFEAIPALSSIAITTAPTKTTYVEGEVFNAAGMVVTATYADDSTNGVTASCTWNPSGALTLSDTEITVRYTENNVTKTTKQTITVNPQPLSVTVSISQSLFPGVEFNNNNQTTEDAITAIVDNVEMTMNEGTSNTYVKSGEMRGYSDGSLVFNAPTGFYLRKIVFTKGSNWSMSLKSGDAGSLSGQTWSTTTNTDNVTFNFGGRTDITGITVTLSKTSSIAINKNCNDGEGNIYGTFSSDFAFIVPSGITVSAVGISEGKLVVTNYSTNDIVKAGTGVMVKAESSVDVNQTILLTGEIGTEKSGNILKASGDAGITAEAMAAASASGTKFYRLTMHDGTKLGFYYGAENGAAFALAANKAYLAVPETLAKESFSISFDQNNPEEPSSETDGINTVENNTEKGIRYNLAGQKVDAAYKGIVIVNGKKYVRK